MKNNTTSEDKAVSKNLKQAKFDVSGNCGMCKARLEKAAKSVKGISTAVWDMKTKKIDVNFDNKLKNADAIQKVIASVGLNSGKHKASDEVYNALPDCCKYRK